MTTFVRSLTILTLFLFGVLPAYAHVVVKPSEAGVGSFQTFTVGVPVERDMPTTGVRLVIPDSLTFVTPNVKSGWIISTKKIGEGENAKITEISWTGGSIPAGQRDDFLFSAKVPSHETKLVWKAYQTYQNGDVVSWDIDASAQPKDASGQPDFSKSGPYSETKVIDDLSESTASPELSLLLSIAALAFSLVAIVIARRR